MKPAFQFDSRFCTGCKTCQAACKDKNNLPAGILWRRVYEVSGGSWEKQGSAWLNDIFAYNISMACNHCEHPICVGVCPVNAYSVNTEGIVLLDQSKCMGCGYCSWACPYGAPQIDPVRGVMTKCDFCIDELDQGRQPACVSACPMRCLEWIDLEIQVPDDRFRQSIPPMAEPESRKPKIFITPHQAVNQELNSGASIVNKEEVQPRWQGRFEEFPLVAFTLLAQAAIGAFWGFLGIIYLNNWKLDFIVSQFSQSILVVCLLLIGTGLVISFKHLKNPFNAWKVLFHLKKSWLSREILFSGLFLFMIFSLLIWNLFNFNPAILYFILPLTGIIGLAAILSMANVYQLKSVSSWNSINTPISFLLTAAILGPLLVMMIETFLYQVPPNQVLLYGWLIGISLLVLVSLIFEPKFSLKNKKKNFLRITLASLGFLIGLFTLINTMTLSPWMMIVILIIYILEEILGRVIFYSSRSQQF